MNYCLNFAKSSKTLIKDATEINIIYNKNDVELPAFIEAHPGQRINLILIKPEDAFDDIDIKKFQAIAEKYPEAQLHLCLYSARKMAELDTVLISKVKETGLPWFTGNIATNWDAVMYLISLGVSDIYIGEDLGFELPIVSRTCRNNKVKVRMFPNVAQSSISTTPALKQFFIRPEDLQEYGRYIDTIEFWGELEKQDVYYHIYKRGKWQGKLSSIIINFNSDMENSRVLPIFGSARMNCNKRCLRSHLNCVICENVYKISKNRN